MPENRIENVTAAGSPTGVPMIPVKAVPWLMLAVALAEALAQALPPHTIGAKVAHGAVSLAALLGLASPGLRKR